jgi:lipopolysaccharide transport system ATP-binding protein
VKRYSSGMYVRLAFAVASHLDPEILIVDEVLAVGDAAFQRRSLGRLNEASRQQGRTVLFVSHSLQAIRTFCRRVLVLDRGRLIFDGPTDEGISRYLRAAVAQVTVHDRSMKDRLNRTSGDVRFTDVWCLNEQGEPSWQVTAGGTVRLRFAFEVVETVPDLEFILQLRAAGSGEPLTAIKETISEGPVERGKKGIAEVVLPAIPLRPNELSLYVVLARRDNRVSYDVIDENVDLPFLRVTSDNDDRFQRIGSISLAYRFDAGLDRAATVLVGAATTATVLPARLP